MRGVSNCLAPLDARSPLSQKEEQASQRSTQRGSSMLVQGAGPPPGMQAAHLQHAQRTPLGLVEALEARRFAQDKDAASSAAAASARPQTAALPSDPHRRGSGQHAGSAAGTAPQTQPAPQPAPQLLLSVTAAQPAVLAVGERHADLRWEAPTIAASEQTPCASCTAECAAAATAAAAAAAACSLTHVVEVVAAAGPLQVGRQACKACTMRQCHGHPTVATWWRHVTGSLRRARLTSCFCSRIRTRRPGREGAQRRTPAQHGRRCTAAQSCLARCAA